MAHNFNRAEILQHLKFDSTPELWQNGWDISEESFSEAALSFIESVYVRRQCDILELGDELADALVAGVSLFARQPALKRLLWHCHIVLFKQPDLLDDTIWQWPSIPKALDEAAPLFYIYVCLSNLPTILAQHQQRDIPYAVSVDTLRDLQLHIKRYREAEGVWGLYSVAWLRYSFVGKLYKLGRLQFEMAQNHYQFPVYRNQQTGQVIALAGDGMQFRQDGYQDGVNHITDSAAWVATYRETETGICGNPVHPRGYALNQMIELAHNEWQLILKPDDTVLGVHIPATGPMYFAECGESFARALPFFARHFPEFSAQAFTCTSWLLDDQFTNLLPPTSNIVRFLQCWYLLPLSYSSDAGVLGRVFGAAANAELDTLPRRTSLQRAVVNHMKHGGHWRGTGGVIIPDDQLRWGNQSYRHNFML